MNVKQLEKLRRHVAKMKDILNEDTEGIIGVETALDDLITEVDDELKNLLWVKYLEVSV